MRSGWIVVLAALLAELSGWTASAGSIELRDGQRHEGRVSFLAGDHLAVVCADGSTQRVAFSAVLRAVFDPPPEPASRVVPAQPLALWASRDLGKVYAAGGREIDGDKVLLIDAGHGFGRNEEDPEDSIHFLFQPVRGDVEVVARLRDHSEGRFSRAGVMVRQSLAPGALFAMAARGDRGVSILLARKAEGRPVVQGDPAPLPILGATWLKVVRQGHLFHAYESSEGETWTKLGTVQLPVPSDAEVYAGLAAGSARGPGRTGVALFDQVQVSAATGTTEAGWAPAGLVTCTGSVLAATLRSADETRLVFARGDGRERSVACSEIAQILFHPLSPDQWAALDRPTSGLLLLNGEFIEGEFKGLTSEEVVLSSVLFGLRRHPRRNALALVLNRLVEPAGSWAVQLRDRSRLQAGTISFPNGQFLVHDPTLGLVAIALEDLVEIRRFETPGSAFPPR